MTTTSLIEQVLDAAYRAKIATTSFSRQAELYELRTLLTEQNLEVILSLDAELQRNEVRLDNFARDGMRRLGYQFPEDLDNVPELLERNDEEEY